MHLVVGDIHGCYRAFKEVLKKSKFREHKDKLWLTGDLVNRGPKSADVVRHVMELGDRAKMVLGNHDLHLLAIAAGVAQPKRGDNSHKLLDEPDADVMINWLGSRSMALYNPKHDFLMVHAAVHKNWSCKDTMNYAGEIETTLRSKDHIGFLKNMYGPQPKQWKDDLKGWDRLRIITNILTRARFCQKDGTLDLTQKGPPGSQPKSLYPWYDAPDRKSANQQIYFGHWSALGFYQRKNILCLDGGYLWGGSLTGIKLKNKNFKIIQISHD